MALNSLFSPNGFSVGNLFNPTDVVLANGDITAGNSVTANYFLGNGAFLTGIVSGNTTVSNTAPLSAQQGDVWIQANTGVQYIYFTSGGNSQWAEMEAAISISSGGAGGNYDNSNVAAYLDGSAGNIIPAANITYSLGNSTRQWANLWVSGNTIYIGGTAVGISNGQLTVGGNSVVTEGSNSTGNISTTGNVTGGNVIANYIYGDISNTSGGNSAVLTLLSSNTFYNITTTGAIAANTVQAQYLYGNGSFITGLPATFGNANLVTYGEAGWSGNIIPTGNGTYNLGNNTSRWNDVYVNSTLYLPFQNFTSNTTRIIASSSLSAYDLISTNDITAVANITATGNVSGSYVLGNIRFSSGGYNDANVAAYLPTYTGALTNLTGNITTTGNVSAAYVLGNGAFLSGISGGSSTYGNSNVADYLASNAALTINTTANISSSANISAGNFIGTSQDTIIKTDNYLWTFDSNGSLTVPGNINANNYSINNLAYPGVATDAVNKQYVDDAVSAGIHIHDPVYLESPTALNATYVQGGNTATVTTTLAGNTVVFSSAINPQVNDQYWFTNSFNGVVANVPYFVVSAPNTSAAVLSTNYNGVPVSNITNATGLTQSVRINSGQGATLTNAGANAALEIDGVTVSVSQRILIYTQANAVQNGVYTVTDTGNATARWVLTRSSDANVYSPDNNNGIDQGSYFFVQAGNTGAGESYVMTSPAGAFIIGYDNIEFTQFSASPVYSANTSAGLTLSGTVFAAKVDNTTTAFDGSGNIIVKTGANLVTPNIGAATGTSLTVTGNITSSANISGTYILGNGAFLTGVAAGGGGTYGNSNVADYLASNAAVTILTTGNISSSANISGGNFIGTSSSNTTIKTGANTWNFASDGTLYLPGNIAAGYRDIPQISWTGTPTMAASDAGKHYLTEAGGVSITLPASSVLPIGAAVTLINQSASNCSIIVPSGSLMFLAGNSTSANRTLSHYGFCTVIKTGLEMYFVSGANVI